MSPCAAGGKEQRAPLLGPTAHEVEKRHKREVDELGSELQELRRQTSEVEPRLARELQEARRLRRDLEHVRREKVLCERALDQHDAERCRFEALLADAAAQSLRLEATAARHVEASPAVQRMLRAEGEAEEVQAEKEQLLQKLQKLELEGRSREQQVRALSDAVARRSVDLGGVAPTVLYSLADARERFESAQARIAAAGADASDLLRDASVQRLETDEARCANYAEEALASRLVAELEVAKVTQSTALSEFTWASEANISLVRSAAALSEECASRRESILDDGSAVARLVHKSALLKAEFGHAELAVDEVTAAHSEGTRGWLEQNAALYELLAEYGSEDDDLRLANTQKMTIEELELEVSWLQWETARSEASRHELAQLGLDTATRDQARSQALGQARQAGFALLLVGRDSRNASMIMERELLEERQIAEQLAARVGELLDEREEVSEEVRAAAQRCESALSLPSGRPGSEVEHLRERERCLSTHLAAREELQAGLAWDVEQALQELREVRASHRRLLQENAAVRRENASLSALLNFDDSL